MSDRYNRIIRLLVGHVPAEVLQEVYLELDKFDTEAKREILAAKEDLQKPKVAPCYDPHCFGCAGCHGHSSIKF